MNIDYLSLITMFYMIMTSTQVRLKINVNREDSCCFLSETVICLLSSVHIITQYLFLL